MYKTTTFAGAQAILLALAALAGPVVAQKYTFTVTAPAATATGLPPLAGFLVEDFEDTNLLVSVSWPPSATGYTTTTGLPSVYTPATDFVCAGAPLAWSGVGATNNLGHVPCLCCPGQPNFPGITVSNVRFTPPVPAASMGFAISALDCPVSAELFVNGSMATTLDAIGVSATSSRNAYVTVAINPGTPPIQSLEIRVTTCPAIGTHDSVVYDDVAFVPHVPQSCSQIQNGLDLFDQDAGAKFEVRMIGGAPSPTNPGFVRYGIELGALDPLCNSLALQHVLYVFDTIDAITNAPLEFKVLSDGSPAAGNPNGVSYEVRYAHWHTGIMPLSHVVGLPGLDLMLRRDGPQTAGTTSWIDIKLPNPASKVDVSAVIYGGRADLPRRRLP
jgi:hypothetical protein